MFFAVCRGKVSEGLNFTDRAGRAVVITGVSPARVCCTSRSLLTENHSPSGIPYSMKTDPKARWLTALKYQLADSHVRRSYRWS